ncbi:MAG: PorP/SprF family type IX secretion system membrane protein [Bacteroidota bacterium]
MKKTIAAFFCVLLISNFVQSQDIHFSQFYASPLTLNAANTGNIDGKFRATANYRDQWAYVSAPFKTSTLAVDFALNQKKKNFFGAGILGIYDKTGTGELTNKSVYASGAYHLHFGKADTPKHYLHIGFQAGLVSKSVNFNKLIFASQYNPATKKFSNYQLTNAHSSFSYFDANIGAAWSSVFSKKFSLIGGINFMHITHPKEQFLLFNTKEVLNTTSIFHITTNYKFNQKISVSPAIYMLKQTSASELTIGSSINYNLKKATIIAGGYFRLADAFIIMLGTQAQNTRIGLSYDFNISNLHLGSNYRGGFEISLAYCPVKTNKKLVFYPKN